MIAKVLRIFLLLFLSATVIGCMTPSIARIERAYDFCEDSGATVIVTLRQQKIWPPSEARLILHDTLRNRDFMIDFEQDAIVASVNLPAGDYQIGNVSYAHAQVDSSGAIIPKLIAGEVLVRNRITIPFKPKVDFTVTDGSTLRLGVFTIEYHGTSSPWIKYESITDQEKE